MQTRQNNKKDDPKAYFHQVSSEMESVLERYKNQYPKNLGQIIRHYFGKIVVVTVTLFFAIAYFSMSPTLVFFIFTGIPGVFAFAYCVNSSTQIEQVEEDVSLKKIEQLKYKLQPLESYPDVKKYSEGFDERVDEVTEQKAYLKARFKRYAVTALVSVACIIVLLLIRIQIINTMGKTDEIFAPPDETYINDVLDIKYDEPFFMLKPLNQGVSNGGNAVEFYVDKFHELHVSGLTVDEEKYGLSHWVLIITDKDGKFVPRCPKFYFSIADPTPSEGYVEEPLRILRFLRDNQDDLRYKIEKL